MGRHSRTPTPRSGPPRGVRLLSASTGFLLAASLTAGFGSPAAAVRLTTADQDAVFQRPPLVPDESLLAGPLALPTIGVPIPDFDERYAAALLAEHPPAPGRRPAVAPLVAAVLPAVDAIAPTVPPAPASGSGEPAAVGPPAEEPRPPAGAAPTDTSPSAGPTVDAPPAEEPPTERPPTEQPPADEPLVEPSPTEQPPTEQPPADEPPAEEPPVSEPPGEEPPAEEPPAEEPPAEEPPVEEPPVEEPPAEEPEPPVDATFALGDGPTVAGPAGGAPAFRLVVQSVLLDVACPGVQAAGRLIGIRVRVTTGADLTPLGAAPTLSSADFSAGEGTLPVPDCSADGESSPVGPLAPGTTLSGTLVLDVPAASGTLTYRPGFLPGAARWGF